MTASREWREPGFQCMCDAHATGNAIRSRKHGQKLKCEHSTNTKCTGKQKFVQKHMSSAGLAKPNVWANLGWIKTTALKSMMPWFICHILPPCLSCTFESGGPQSTARGGCCFQQPQSLLSVLRTDWLRTRRPKKSKRALLYG